MATTSNERPVQALGPDRSGPPLGKRVRPRRPERGADHIDALGKVLVERSRGLVPVMDEKGSVVDCAVVGEVAWPGVAP